MDDVDLRRDRESKWVEFQRTYRGRVGRGLLDDLARAARPATPNRQYCWYGPTCTEPCAACKKFVVRSYL